MRCEQLMSESEAKLSAPEGDAARLEQLLNEKPRSRCCSLARILRLSLLVTAATLIASQQPAGAAKNVILMIADGAGYNTWLAASMYQGKVGKQVYDQPGWVHLSCSTYPLTLSWKPKGNTMQDGALVYDPAKAWDSSRTSGTPGTFAAYDYLVKTYTDSAAAATALSTGRKTYNNAINWSNDDRAMFGQTIAEIAKARGKAVGVVTSVQWSHATPAALGGAHNRSRGAYSEIANEMLKATWLDVIMGAGHPDYDNNGRPLAEGKKRDYRYVGGETTWNELRTGKRPWKLVETKADFESLQSGETPAKVLGTATVGLTLQHNRRKSRRPVAEPLADRLNANVPSLAVMARGAINCLDENPNGFFLMIEGGAVDWANSANDSERMIEEQVDFARAVEAVVAWVDAHSNWDDTLVILTADHESGFLWGPDSAKIAFQPIEDRGPGHVPGTSYNCRDHSNSLVPLYARGAGSSRFARHIRGTDPTAAATWHCSGAYVDNTDIFRVMQAEISAQ